MKDITVFLVNYTEPTTLQKAFDSLNIISSRLHSIIVIHEEGIQFDIGQQFFQIVFHNFKAGKMSKTLHELVTTLQTEYVLFLLQHAEYLSPLTTAATFELKTYEVLLAHTYHHNQTSVDYPLLVRTDFLKKNPFPPEQHFPSIEAIFPAWLSKIDDSFKMEENLVKRGKLQTNRNWLEKHRFLGKYRKGKIQKNRPSLAILIANYNMEKYVENAIASCLYQSEKADKIYIIDDGSSDKSLRKISNWQHHSRIEIFHKQNEGKAKALNHVLPNVSTDFILELDADDWLDPNAISVIKPHLAALEKDAAVLYGNLRRWKQSNGNILFKQVAMGRSVNDRQDLLSYHFPLGPRIYRTSALKKMGGFPVITYQDGRLYEDVSVLNELIKTYRFQYKNFTVYNVREHKESTTRKNLEHWDGFLRNL